jgi:hypothetical protein
LGLNHIIRMMKMLVVLALSAFVAAEPEADPALLYSGYPYAGAYSAGVYGYPYAGPVAYSHPLAYTHHAVAAVQAAPVVEAADEVAAAPAVISTYNAVNPFVYNTAIHHATPVVYNTAAHVAAPVAYASAHVAAPVAYAAVAPVASHTITNYNNPEQYTAVSNGVFGPKYIAKNGPVEHIVKREADADAEADAAFYYSAGYPYANYGYANAYAASPVAYSSYYNHLATPVTYAAGVHHAVAAAPVAYAAAPVAYAAHHGVGLVKTPDHAVAYTAYGATHSSNVGVCTNVNGVQVPC